MPHVLCCLLLATACVAADHIAWNPDGFGRLEGASTNCTRELASVTVRGKPLAYLDLTFTGTEWSGSIINWCGFDVNTVAGDARPSNHSLMLSLSHKDGNAATEFQPLSTWDPKGVLQQKPKGWTELRIPLADLGVTGPVWGLQIGAHSKTPKDAHMWLRQIAFARK